MSLSCDFLALLFFTLIILLTSRAGKDSLKGEWLNEEDSFTCPEYAFWSGSTVPAGGGSTEEAFLARLLAQCALTCSEVQSLDRAELLLLTPKAGEKF